MEATGKLLGELHKKEALQMEAKSWFLGSDDDDDDNDDKRVSEDHVFPNAGFITGDDEWWDTL